MRKVFILLLLLIVAPRSGMAQSSQSNVDQVFPVFQIKTDTGTYQHVDDKYWRLLEDPTGKLTIGQVSSPPFTTKFHINTSRTKGIDYTTSTYWFRFSFKNELSRPVKITVPGDAAYSWLYLPAPNNKWKVQTSGSLLPWTKKDGLQLLSQFVVQLEAGQELIIYKKDINDFSGYNKPKNFDVSIGFADRVIRQTYIENDDDYYGNIIGSLMLGILMLAAFINLSFYRLVREKVYLFFSLFIFFTGLNEFINRTNVGFFREHPITTHNVNSASVIILFFSILHFIRHFLSTKIQTPGWDKFLIFLSYLMAIVWISIRFLPADLTYRTFSIVNLILQTVVYCYFPVILATMLFYIPKSRGAFRTGLVATLPGFTWWGPGFAFLFVSQILNSFYQIPFTKLYLWLIPWRDEIQLFCYIWLVTVFSWILFRRFQDLQRLLVQNLLEKERLAKEKEIERSQLIEKQNVELERQVEERTADLTRSLENLKSAQTQLIQSEKMASLGELTAGIAHEIQNPLNFVNNFSEVNTEMIDELEVELKAGNIQEALVIAADIRENEKKISMHGKRADGIVKGMLQHSKSGSGTKEATNISALADEYIRLSYHGLRSKDKDFNAELVTHFDADLPKINVIPQDMGRVLLNLFNNAFYAVNQKQKTAGADYKPEVSVSTSTANGQILIKVKDNGIGIPDAIKEKIMQPFFTTKPTGEGTGLGLSITYDMVVKGHAGKIDIHTIEGEFSEFTVALPL